MDDTAWKLVLIWLLPGFVLLASVFWRGGHKGQRRINAFLFSTLTVLLGPFFLIGLVYYRIRH